MDSAYGVRRGVHTLQGVIGSAEVLVACRAFAHARLVAFGQGLSLLVMTEEFIGDLRDGGEAACPPRFLSFPAGFDRVLATWSCQGPVAYVEAEYFGGIGVQAAAVWHGDELALGPLTTRDDSPIRILHRSRRHCADSARQWTAARTSSRPSASAATEIPAIGSTQANDAASDTGPSGRLCPLLVRKSQDQANRTTDVGVVLIFGSRPVVRSRRRADATMRS